MSRIKGLFEVESTYEDSGCVICLNDGKDLAVTSCCGKMVHEKCLSNWMDVCVNPSCPHCREEVVSVS